MRQFGYPFYGGAENIAYGKVNGLECIVSLIIDDGVKGRGHRKNVLAPAHRCTGVTFGAHPTFGCVTVLNYAFYCSSFDEGDTLKQILENWHREDEKELEEMHVLKDEAEVPYKIVFEYPNLVKEMRVQEVEGGERVIRKEKDVEEILYPFE